MRGRARYAVGFGDSERYTMVDYPPNDVLSGRTDLDPLLAALRYTSEPADVLSRLFFCTRWCRA